MANNDHIFKLTSVPEHSALPAAGLFRTRHSAGGQMDSGFNPEAGLTQLRDFKKCQDLLKSRLSGHIENLFLEMTGLRLHAEFHRPLDFVKPGEGLALCPAVRRKRNLNGDGELHADCRACLRRRWAVGTQPALEVRRFVGLCGLTTACVQVQTGNAPLPLLTLMVQAQVKNGEAVRRPAVSARDLDRAVALLRLTGRKLTAVLQTQVAHNKLESVQKRLQILEAENTCLRKGTHRRPSNHQALDSRAEHLAQEMVTYVHQHYHRPMSLGQVAAALKMNSSYLSTLFSHTVGMTFHHYLTGVRMAKAKKLLLDPLRRVCEVACAVGYANADQFRHAFKAYAGVPPSAWT